MRAFIEELKAAVTGLGRAPGLMTLAVAVLGLGLATVIFMYGVANTLMLKPAPYPAAERLYSVTTLDGQAPGDYDESVNIKDYPLLREAMGQFEAVGSLYVGTAYLTGDGQAERYDGAFADGELFGVVGVAPQLGRAIEPRDAQPGAAPVVVLGHDLWSERFGADPEVIGRIVRVNGRPAEVIGVMPERYTFPARSQLWVANQQDPARVSRQDAVAVTVYGRLRPDGDLDLAEQELGPVAAQLRSTTPAEIFNGRFELRAFHAGFVGRDGATLIWTLVFAVGFILLIACANVSNLLLARSAYRVRETTVRSALGASRARLVTHMLAEAVVISTLATVLGLLLASVALDFFRIATARMIDDGPAWWSFEIDLRVTAVAVLAAFLSTLMAGLPAAFRASRPALDSLLRDGGRTGTGLAIGRIAWGLVVFEVALACLLLGVSALITAGALRATSSEVGVETADIMTARAGLTAGTYIERAEQVRFWEDLVARIEAQPGIHAAAVTTSLPGHGSRDGPVSIEGRDYGEVRTRPFTNIVYSSPSYFNTLRLAPLEGRLPDSRDSAAAMPVAVISQSMAQRLFPDGSPLGARLRIDSDQDPVWRTVIGVVPNVAYDDDGLTGPAMYIPVAQEPVRFMSLAMRGDGDPRSLIGAARTALAQVDPDLALYWVRTLDEGRVLATAGQRIIGTMFVVFATVALVLAAAGLFGVLAFHVGQRRREIGVRRALGASNRRILELVMRASGLQVLLGIGIGMLLLPVVGSGLGDVLHDDVSPYDPALYGLVLALMLTVAVSATLTPTRRALRVDPAAALRYE